MSYWFFPSPPPVDAPGVVWDIGIANGSTLSTENAEIRDTFFRQDHISLGETAMGYPIFLSSNPLAPFQNSARLPSIAQLASLLPSSMRRTDPSASGGWTAQTYTPAGICVAEAYEQATGKDFWETVWRPVVREYFRSQPGDAAWAYAGAGTAGIPEGYRGTIDTNIETTNFGYPETSTASTASLTNAWGSLHFEFFRRWMLSGTGVLASNQEMGSEYYTHLPRPVPQLTDSGVRAKWYSHHYREMLVTTQELRARAPHHSGHSRFGMTYLPSWYTTHSALSSETRAANINACVDEQTNPNKLGPTMALLDVFAPNLYVAGETLDGEEGGHPWDPFSIPTYPFRRSQRILLWDSYFQVIDRVAAFHRKPVRPFLTPTRIVQGDLYGAAADVNSLKLLYETYLLPRGYVQWLMWGYLREGVEAPNPEGNTNAEILLGLQRILSYLNQQARRFARSVPPAKIVTPVYVAGPEGMSLGPVPTNVWPQRVITLHDPALYQRGDNYEAVEYDPVLAARNLLRTPISDVRSWRINEGEETYRAEARSVFQNLLAANPGGLFVLALTSFETHNTSNFGIDTRPIEVLVRTALEVLGPRCILVCEDAFYVRTALRLAPPGKPISIGAPAETLQAVTFDRAQVAGLFQSYALTKVRTASEVFDAPAHIPLILWGNWAASKTPDASFQSARPIIDTIVRKAFV
jgi:hypothetical protein